MCGFFGLQSFVLDKNEKIIVSKKAIKLLNTRGPDSNGIDLDDNDNSITFYDNDNNSQNELQQLSLNGNNLILSLTNDTIILPFITYSAGSGIVISSGTITNTGDTSNTNELISSVSFNPSSNEIEIIDFTREKILTNDVKIIDSKK
mgnify:CR=1 FL=1